MGGKVALSSSVAECTRPSSARFEHYMGVVGQEILRPSTAQKLSDVKEVQQLANKGEEKFLVSCVHFITRDEKFLSSDDFSETRSGIRNSTCLRHAAIDLGFNPSYRCLGGKVKEEARWAGFKVAFFAVE